MITDSKPLTTSELIQAVGEWAEKNFGTIAEGRRIPHYGLLEEVGEATHCVLKHVQKIRGYEVEDFFRKELKDAFADIMIYLCDYCYIHRSYFIYGSPKEIDGSVDFLRHRNEELIIARVVSNITSIFNYESSMSLDGAEANIPTYVAMSQQLCNAVEIWAAYYGFSLRDITWETWMKVSKRDWNKESLKGGE